MYIESTTSLGKTYYAQMTILPSWRHYWLEEKSTAEFYQALSNQVVNQPYADMPDYWVKHGNTIVYHPNHDCAHSIRQSAYSQFFLKMVQHLGNPSYRHAAEQLTDEECAILKLAVFLCRAGRTNERGGQVDPSNQERSAQLFQAVALEVGFNPSLVNSMAYCVQYQPLTEATENKWCLGFNGDESEQRAKLGLMKRLLHLSHHTDLVRCFSNKAAIEDRNKENLSALIAPEQVDDAVEVSLNYARASAELTGTPYYLHNGTKERVAPPCYLKAYAVIQVNKTMHAVQALGERFYEVLGDVARSHELFLQAQQNNKHTFTEAEEQAALTLQRHFFARRAHEVTKQAVTVSAPEVSKANLLSLKNELRLGEGLSLTEREQKQKAILLPKERELFQYLVHQFEWTLKHITAGYEHIQRDGNVLKSLHQRNREARFNDVRYTSDFEGRADNIYFTLGGPRGWPAEFLQMAKGHEITIPLRSFLKQQRPTDKLAGLWVGSAWYGFTYNGNGRHLTSRIDTTTRQVQYQKINKATRFLQAEDYKLYQYQRGDGTKFERRVSLAAETVTGSELLPFLAYTVILELRLIGGVYREECLDKTAFGTIETLVNVIFEQRNFEALVPSRLDLQDKRIEIKLFNENPYDTVDAIQRMCSALSESNIDALKTLVNEGVSVDIDLGYRVTPLGMCLLNHYSDNTPAIQYLIEQGANTQHRIGGLTMLTHAVLAQKYKVVELILSTGVVEPHDQRIRRLLDVNNEDVAVGVAITKKDWGMLRLLKHYGFHFDKANEFVLDRVIRLPEMDALPILSFMQEAGLNALSVVLMSQESMYRILRLAIEEQKTQVLTVLLDLGFNPNSTPYSAQSSLLELAQSLNHSEAVVLLQNHHAISSNLNHQKEHQVHLVVEGERGVLVARKRKIDGSSAPQFQAITALLPELSIEAIKKAIFSAVGIQAQEFTYQTIAEIEKENNLHETVALLQMKGLQQTPVQTEEWADCQWMSPTNPKGIPLNPLVTTYLKGSKVLQQLLRNQLDLLEAIKEEDCERVLFLMNEGVIDDTQDALYRACDTHNPSLKLVMTLLSSGYDANAEYLIGEDSYTPLMLAIVHHRLDLVDLLINQGACVNQTVGPLKITPLMLAAELDQLDMVEFLLQKGASLDNPANRSILAYVCMKECSDRMFDYLIEHQADRDALFDGMTPLLFVAEQGNLHRVEVLLQKGVDTEVKHPSLYEKAKCLVDYEAWALFEKYTREKGNTSNRSKSISFYLNLTGNGEIPDLVERLSVEYDIHRIQGNSELSDFARQLLNDAGMDGSYPKIHLAIAHSGDAPVFSCYGFDEPVIAIHKDYLLSKGVDYRHLCFAVAHELAYIKHFGTHLIKASAAERMEFDKNAFPVCPHGALLIDFLQQGDAFIRHHQSPLHFHWPRECYTGDYTANFGSYFFAERVKAMRLHLVQNPKSSLPAGEAQSIANDVLKAVGQLKKMHYYVDFPRDGTAATQYQYLCHQLPTLKDELLPFQFTDIPSARLKEFGRLLSTIPYEEAELDCLLEQALDLQIPGFAYLYKTACRVSPEEVVRNDGRYSTPRLRPLGYFNKMHQAMAQFKEATTYEAAQQAHEDMMSLYPKLVEHGHNGLHANTIFSYIHHWMPVHSAPLPAFRSDIGCLIDWPFFEAGCKQHLSWAKDYYAQCPSFWKGLWIMGVIDQPELYELMPQAELLALSDYVINEREYEFYSAKHDAIIPRPLLHRKNDSYPLSLAQFVLPYWVSRNPLDPTMLQRELNQGEWEAFIQINYPHFVSHRDDDPLDREEIRYLLNLLSEVVNGTPIQQQLVRHFFLSDDAWCWKDLMKKGPNKLGAPPDSLYVRFLITHASLFSSHELIDFLCNYIDAPYTLPIETLFQFWGLDTKDSTYLDNLLYVINDVTSRWHIRWALTLLQHYLSHQQSLPIFAKKTYQLIEALNHLDSNGSSLSNMVLAKIHWQSIADCSLETRQCVILYRILDRHVAFPNQAVRAQLGELIMEKINNISSPQYRLELLESLLFVRNSASSLSLQDRVFFKQVAGQWVHEMLAWSGKDDNTRTYAYAMKQRLNKIYHNTRYQETLYLLSNLANAIEAQAEVSVCMERLIAPELSQYQIKQHVNHFMLLTKVFELLNKNNQDKQAVLDFIASPLSKTSLDTFIDHMMVHPKKADILRLLGLETSTVDREICSFAFTGLYQRYWDLKLKERALVLDSLIISVEKEASQDSHQKAYLEGFYYVAKKLFPQSEHHEREEFALALLTTYLQEADTQERQFLLATLLVVNNDLEGTQTSLGRKLALLCEHMGPAYIKLAQAIHSHPDTPADVKQDLAHVKGRANPPYRWDIWRLINQVLSPVQRDKMVHLGGLLGSASYNLALEVTTAEKEEQVLLLLRDKAREEAEKGFAHLRRTILACPHPVIEHNRASFLHVIDAAQKMSDAELSHQVGDKQHEMATVLYRDNTILVKVGCSGYQIIFEVTQSLESGEGYRRLTRMHGTEFNDLPQKTVAQRNIRKAIALAVMEKELSLIFSGYPFDCDRHGSQLRVTIRGHQITLGLYDFGEMSLEPLTEEELCSLAALLYELPQTMKQGDSVHALFQKHIDKTIASGCSSHHLTCTHKALLALQDFQKELKHEEIKSLFYKIRNRLHPQLAQALARGSYSQMSYLDRSYLLLNTVREIIIPSRKQEMVFPLIQWASESVLDWWIKQEQAGSLVPIPITEQLVKQIKTINHQCADEIKTLFKECDRWLLLARSNLSPHYSLVQSLYQQLENRLIGDMGVSEIELARINRDNLKQTNYLQKYWEQRAAERFGFFGKSRVIQSLNKAFAAHAVQEPSLDADEQLLQTLTEWLLLKGNERSSYYNLVVDLRQQILEMIEKTYSVSWDELQLSYSITI